METTTKFCQHCGAGVFEDAVVCPQCGRSITGIHPGKGVPKNKWIAVLLCLFTGFGHKFYEGKIGMGILYMLTLGLFGIGALIDLIKLLMLPDDTYYV
jgi:restriction system protein